MYIGFILHHSLIYQFYLSLYTNLDTSYQKLKLGKLMHNLVDYFEKFAQIVSKCLSITGISLPYVENVKCRVY